MWRAAVGLGPDVGAAPAVQVAAHVAGSAISKSNKKNPALVLLTLAVGAGLHHAARCVNPSRL